MRSCDQGKNMEWLALEKNQDGKQDSQKEYFIRFSSVQFSLSVVSDSLRPHGLQHARPPCPSPTPGVYSNSCPLSRWFHPTISLSVVPFSSRLQSFPASGSFQMSQLFTSGGQTIGVSASASVLPMISFKMDWLDLLAVQESSLGLMFSRVFSNTTVQKHRCYNRRLDFLTNKCLSDFCCMLCFGNTVVKKPGCLYGFWNTAT